MSNSDRAMLYLLVAMVGTSEGADGWCVFLAAITAGFYAVRAIRAVRLRKEAVK